MRLIQLPPLMPGNEVEFGTDSDGTWPPREDVAAFNNGCFRFIELDDENPCRFRWRGHHAQEGDRFIAKLGRVPHGGLCRPLARGLVFPGLVFPQTWDAEEKRLTLDKVLSQHLTLDM